MKFGLSTVVYEPKFLKLAMIRKDWEKLYLEYLDSGTKLASRLGFKIIEVSGLFFNAHEILPPIIKQIKDKLKPFKQVSWHTPIKFISVQAMKECILIGKKVGAKKIVIHPHFLSLTPGFKESTSKKILEVIKSFKESKLEEILELIKFCKKQNLIPCMENLPTEVPKYNRPEEFDFLVKKGAYLTVDTGHAITVNVDPVSFLERFGKKVRNIHLQDGLAGMPDEHYALGDGEIDIRVAIRRECYKKFE